MLYNLIMMLLPNMTHVLVVANLTAVGKKKQNYIFDNFVRNLTVNLKLSHYSFF